MIMCILNHDKIPEESQPMEISHIIVKAWPRNRVQCQVSALRLNAMNAVCIPTIRAIWKQRLGNASHSCTTLKLRQCHHFEEKGE